MFFKLLYIHEEVLEQVKSERALRLVGDLLSRGVLRLYPWSSADESEFLRLREEVVADPRVPALERPDLLCLIMAKSLGAVLLSENVGIHRVVQFHPRYEDVTVWTALELLENMLYAGIVNASSVEEFIEIVREYERDTAHVFKSKRLAEALERVRMWLRR